MEQPSKEWVTHETHRVFEEEFSRHAAVIESTIRKVMKDELHPKHGEHHVLYASDLDLRNSAKKGAMSSLGGMFAQAIVIALLISLVSYIKGG